MNLTTVCIQIGNSDDKLTQEQWSQYCKDLTELADQFCFATHFAGFSPGGFPWQNFCLAGQISAEAEEAFCASLKELRSRFSQDSAAVLVGETRFV